MRSLKSALLMHILIAIGLSLVINFSYLLAPIISEQGMNQRGEEGVDAKHSHGFVRMQRELDAYIVCDCGEQDSVYVSAWQVRTMKLREGDYLRFSSKPVPKGDTYTSKQISDAHPRLQYVLERNGKEFDFDALYDRPSRTVEFIWQIGYYAVISLLLILIATYRFKRDLPRRYTLPLRILGVVITMAVAIYFAPVTSFKDGTMSLDFFFRSDLHNNTYLIVLTKSLFVLVVSVLYTFIFRLMNKQHNMAMENERLKTENLSTRYNMLMGQINPHFFFNSLNSLAMLVRERDNDRALEYIDQLSYTFRYIIQNGQSEVTTLRDELEFARAYAYLFKIRYADKLFFDFDVEERYLDWTLPALSLQPLIGNTVKHNSITSKHPLRVVIRVVDGVLEIENAKHPKLDVEPSTGIGLDNLRKRWDIITGHSIEILDEAERFVVRLPLEQTQK